MKQYPSIPREIRTDVPILAFDKMDGSLIRAEWSRKNGFYKFGRKGGLLDHACPILLKAPAMICEKYAEQLSQIFRQQRWDKVIAFFEFFGDRSFAGRHEEEDCHKVVLFDVNPYKQGVLDPRDFVKTFGELDTPALLYRGRVNQELVQSVRDSVLQGMSFEGIVCKGSNPKKPGHRLMFKIKSDAWTTKLKEFCGTDERKFKELL